MLLLQYQHFTQADVSVEAQLDRLPKGGCGFVESTQGMKCSGQTSSKDKVPGCELNEAPLSLQDLFKVTPGR